MRMVFTHYLAHNTCGLLGVAGEIISEFVHAEKHATVNRLEAVSDIGQRPGYND
ncbi:hypothetical protein IMSAG025_01086 [Muribaculaceae bacterium]|nr:hypothetical protein IMSAG025_01086 [Muribaculaceae bacterium]